MKNSACKIVSVVASLLFLSAQAKGQMFTCSYTIDEAMSEYPINSESNINNLKTIKIVIHFPLRNDGSGNFSETCNLYGEESDDNGYWFAERVVYWANYHLMHNVEMEQQLSNQHIPVLPINIQYQLVGIRFHRSNNLFNGNSYLPYYAVYNGVGDGAIHVTLRSTGPKMCGASSGENIFLSGMDTAYMEFLNLGREEWAISHYVAKGLNHEVGHSLNLRHPKRSGSGSPCFNDNSNCIDRCDDTPTYLQLIADGHPDPYNWCDSGLASNNVMDYTCRQLAWTPCQIQTVHNILENYASKYLDCRIKVDTATVTGNIIENKIQIAKEVTTKNVFVPISKTLYIHCNTFQTTGNLDIPMGANMEINTVAACPSE